MRMIGRDTVEFFRRVPGESLYPPSFKVLLECGDLVVAYWTSDYVKF